MQRFRARKLLEPPKGGFDMDPLTLMETNICDEEPCRHGILGYVWLAAMDCCTFFLGGLARFRFDLRLVRVGSCLDVIR